jgi:hypothetical protein
VASLLPLTQLTNLTKFDLTSTDYDSDEEGEDAGSHLHMGFWNTAQVSFSVCSVQGTRHSMH